VARVFTWWHGGVYASLAPPLIFIEYVNWLLSHRPISTLI
jgi:hypothetical protein